MSNSTSPPLWKESIYPVGVARAFRSKFRIRSKLDRFGRGAFCACQHVGRCRDWSHDQLTRTLAAIVAVWAGSAAAKAATPIETPWFQKKVATGKLPPVAARLPQSPRIIRLEPRRAWRHDAHRIRPLKGYADRCRVRICAANDLRQVVQSAVRYLG